jgi:putative Holliday junction resolvase
VSRRERRGRILGLDPGERRIGVALSDAGGIIAQPHEVIDRHTDAVPDRLQALIDEYAVDRIVVGLPVSLSGDEGPAAALARSFGSRVAEWTGLVVEYADERFSTVTAERVLLESGLTRKKRRDVRDKVAAAVMLQAFLDHESRP